MANLIVKNKKGEFVFSLHGNVTIGRHPENTICIPDLEISKHHATITYHKGSYVFKDIGSVNGSYYNGELVSEHVFSHNDVIRIGHNLLTFDAKDKHNNDNDLVRFEAFDEAQTTEIQARVEIRGQEHFLPEKDVKNDSELREDYEKLRLGHQLLQHIGLEQDLDKLLKSLAKQLLPMFDADRSVILLANDYGELQAKAVCSNKTLQAPIIVSQSVLKEVQKSKSAVLLSKSDSLDEITEVESLKVMGITSVMCAPIIHKDIVIGAIHLDLQSGQGLFLKKDLELLSSISAYIATVVANAALTKKISHDIKMQAQFERLLSPSIAKQLVSGELSIGQAGELKPVTIMFVDIRGFTSMSQTVSPEHIVSLLNEYFERVVEIVFKYGGTVDKFMGDAVMVLFGAPLPMKHQEDAALSCALEIQQMLGAWNKERLKKKQSLIPVGIGINSGEVVVGAIGSTKTMQYTCIGNAVNIASRITGSAKAGQVIISKTTMDAIQSPVQSEMLSPAEFKGIDGKLECFIVSAIGRKA